MTIRLSCAQIFVSWPPHRKKTPCTLLLNISSGKFLISCCETCCSYLPSDQENSSAGMGKCVQKTRPNQKQRKQVLTCAASPGTNQGRLRRFGQVPTKASYKEPTKVIQHTQTAHIESSPFILCDIISLLSRLFP